MLIFIKIVLINIQMDKDDIKDNIVDTMLDIYYDQDICSATFLISLDVISVYLSLENEVNDINKIIYCSIFIATSFTENFNVDLLSKNGIKNVSDDEVCSFFKKIFGRVNWIKYYGEFGTNRIISDMYIMYSVYCFKKNIINIQYSGITKLFEFLTQQISEIPISSRDVCSNFVAMIDEMDHCFDKNKLDIIRNTSNSLQQTYTIQNNICPLIRGFPLKKIASGSYGAVCISQHKKKKMAQKTCEHVTSFIKEVICLISMKNDNIISIGGVGKKGYEIYMDLMDCDLDDYAVKTKRQDIILSSILCGCINAIQYIHSIGLIHRDIKPKNILIKETWEEPIVKLCDFGICGNVVSGTAELTSCMYTFPYRPPECFDKNGYDFTADIWAFGCTVYEIFQQKLLFPYSPKLERRIRSKKSFINYYSCLFTNDIIDLETDTIPSSIINIIRGCVTMYPRNRISSQKILTYLHESL